MKNRNSAIRLIAVQLGLATSVALGAHPFAGREGHPITRSRLFDIRSGNDGYIQSRYGLVT